MNASAKKQNKRISHVNFTEFLRAAPYANESMTITAARDGGAMAKIPMKRPRWLVPPFSWIFPFSPQRQVRLDAVGFGVLKLCDGNKTVESVIEEFAEANKLSFREAQLPVTQFLKQMIERGIVIVVGSKEKANKQ